MNWEYLESDQSEITLKGRGVSSGLAFGQIHVNARGFSAPEVYEITDSQISAELEKFSAATAKTKTELEALASTVKIVSGDNESQIFEAHILLLEDHVLIKKVEKLLRERLVNVEYCYYAIIQSYMEALRRSQDSYLAERTGDIQDVALRLLNNLLQTSVKSEVKGDHILVAYDLTPSDTINLDRQKMLGFATEQGSYTSHTAILARSLGLPAVVGVEEAVMKVRGLASCILDGTRGLLILNPSRETVSKYQQLYKEELALKERLSSETALESKTSDGREITLSANVEFAHEVESLHKIGAEGIGLYRTEFFLLKNEEVPTELEQAELYGKVLSHASPHQVIFRTLDSGGDKMSGEDLEEPEPNPFLGWRGIRFSLARPEVFKVQLRALLRATVHGNLGIMFPMVSQLSELIKAKSLLAECHEELLQEGVPLTHNYQVGVMIEVPSAAILAECFAKEVDFFSVGTNDLVQYTTAVDRINPLVNDLYRPADPGVIRLIKMTVDGARASKIWTGVCGEMASDLELLPVLIGLGVEELSVGKNKVPLVKSAIRRLSYEECSQLVEKVLSFSRAKDIRKASREIAERCYPALIAQEPSFSNKVSES